MVMTGGMLFQQADVHRLIDLAHAHGKPVVVGGPDVTSQPASYRERGLPGARRGRGRHRQVHRGLGGRRAQGTFEAPKFQIDVTKTPIPRFDLLKFDHYLYIGVQYSRGCPFTCEFCDIIELYGRVPRTKTNEQMLAELDALYGSAIAAMSISSTTI